jgi:hypothetical protein
MDTEGTTLCARCLGQQDRARTASSRVNLLGWTNEHEQVFGDRLESHNSVGASACTAQPSRMSGKRRTGLSLHDWGLGRVVAWAMSTERYGKVTGLRRRALRNVAAAE